MFAKSITCSDDFLDMPATSQNLYFHLSMNADDDGFVDKPKGVMRMIGAKDDDMKILLAKSFVLPFDSGVIVIRHWRINNYIQKDRKRDTNYIEELKMLKCDKTGAYTFDIDGLDVGYKSTERKPLTDAQQKRLDAKNDSSLPYSFDYKIKRVFIGKTCPLCGISMNTSSKMTQPTIQHNIPISKGGKHELSNISIICGKCNYSIQDNETQSLNNSEVVSEWEKIIGNVSGMDTQVSIGKDSIDKNNSSINTTCAVPEPDTTPKAQEKIIISFILNDKSEYEVTETLYNQFVECYPAVDVMQELKKIKAWCFSNPTLRKTKRGVLRFMNGWLERAQNKGGYYGTKNSRNYEKPVYESGYGTTDLGLDDPACIL